MYLAYEQLPQIPEIFMSAIYEKIAQGKDEFDKKYNAINYEFYSLQDQSDFINWVRAEIISKIIQNPNKVNQYKIGVHLIKHKIAIHKDHNRDATINYILDPGGDAVVTRFYDEDQKTEIKEVQIPVKTWHALQTNIFHGIHGISPDRKRIAITIGVDINDIKF